MYNAEVHIDLFLSNRCPRAARHHRSFNPIYVSSPGDTRHPHRLARHPCEEQRQGQNNRLMVISRVYRLRSRKRRRRCVTPEFGIVHSCLFASCGHLDFAAEPFRATHGDPLQHHHCAYQIVQSVRITWKPGWSIKQFRAKITVQECLELT